MEAIDAVVKPLVDSAIAAGEKAGSFLLDAGETAVGAVAFVLTAGVGHTATEEQDTINGHAKKDSAEPEPAAASGGQGVRGGVFSASLRNAGIKATSDSRTISAKSVCTSKIGNPYHLRRHSRSHG
jgi:hypothetical protein